MEDRLIVLGGATASGKSACAVALCKRIGGEVVSCDSMQLYRSMDIGTAKPTVVEMAGVRHHLIDVLEPTEECSAARYRALALPVIEDIRARGRVPVLCGGTGLYINALTKPLGFAVKGDEAIRARLEALAQTEEGRENLHKRLDSIDPESAKRLHVNDVRRVIRAIEIYETTGMTKTEQALLDRSRKGDYEARLFALEWPRETLYARIERRVDEMCAQGLFEEVESLLKRGIPMDASAMQAIGYKELIPAITGQKSRDEAIALLKQNTRRYAKRQTTWFRGDERTVWIQAEGREIGDISREMEGYIRGTTIA